MITYVLNNQRIKNNCINYIYTLPDKTYECVFRKVKRTGQQNKYYWVVVAIIADSLGYSSDEMHEALKRNFIGSEQGKDCFGNVYIKAKSSAKLNKDDFIDYLNKVLIFAQNENIEIPEPDTFGFNKERITK